MIERPPARERTFHAYLIVGTYAIDYDRRNLADVRGTAVALTPTSAAYSLIEPISLGQQRVISPQDLEIRDSSGVVVARWVDGRHVEEK